MAKAKLLSPIERAKKGQQYFDKWFDNGNKFFRAYNLCFNDDLPSQAIFLLHQTVESYYMAIVLVFTDHKPKTHELDILGKEAGMLDKRFKQAFPLGTSEETRLFDLLKRAYIDSRYKMGYVVAKEDLAYLATRVHKLKELTELICTERIKKIKEG